MEKNEMQFSKIIEETTEDKREPVQNDVEPEEINKDNPEKFRKVKGIYLWIILVPVIIAVIIVMVTFLTVKKANTYAVPENAYQHYMIRLDIPNGSEIEIDDSGNFMLCTDGEKQSLDGSTPIYYDNEKKMTILDPMVYYAPAMPGIRRAEYFTDISINENGRILAERDGKREDMQNGFLYNGKNMYVFLQPVDIYVNNHIYSLPALSYVEATYMCDTLIYNHETGEAITEPTGSEMKAVAGDKNKPDYIVYLLNDSIEYSNGDNALLFSRPDLLDPIIEE